MKRSMLLIPFLTFLIAANASPTPTQGSFRGNVPQYGGQYSGSRGTAMGDKDKGYKITIKLEDAFGKVAEDFSKINELDADVKFIKLLLEEIIPDIKDIKKSVSGQEGSRETTAPYALKHVAAANNSSRLATTYQNGSLNIDNIWEISVPKSNCAELRLRGNTASGVYGIQPDRSQEAISAYCDMKYDSGGWTVIQRRGVQDIPKSERISFYQNWDRYENGFGHPASDYWIGLKNIHALTKDCNNELMINMTSWDGISTFARYSRFNISGKDDFYRLHVSGYSGNAGEALLHHNNMRFTTYDRQNDQNGDDNCAQLYKGAWWYKDCFWSNLNGEYAEDGSAGRMSTRQGIEWGSRHFYSLMKTEMKIKPKC